MSGEDEFGVLLRAYRRSAGLSQQEVAERSGLGVRTVSNLERGRTRWPYPDSVHRLADALELSGTPRAGFLAAAGRRLARPAQPGATGTSGSAWPADPAGALDATGAVNAMRPAGATAPPGAPAHGGGAHAGRKRVVPRLLPAAVSGFAGRRDQLTALSQVLSHPGGTAVITAIGGTAGVGKTALALQWAHQVAQEFPDGQLYVNLRGFDPSGIATRPADAVRVLLDALEIRADQLPQTEEAQLGLYRSLLAGKRMLVLLDNARDTAQVRPLLPGAPTCRVIVTSRSQLTGLAAIEAARPLMLDVLTDAEAGELLEQRLGAARLAADPAAAEQIIGACARLPLALSVIAARAAMQPDLSLAEIAGDLAGSPSLDAFADGDDPAADLRAAFSWSLRQLDPAAARFFRLAGLHPGPDFDRYAMAALAGEPAGQAGRLLEVLTRACLIQHAGPGRYGMHDLLRGYARELSDATDGGPEQRAALTRLFDYYLHAAGTAMDAAFPAERGRRPAVPPPPGPVPAFASAADALAWLDAERANLVPVTAHAAGHGWPAHATRLAATLFRYLDIGRHYQEATAVHGSACRAARQAGDQPAEATALNHLGAVGVRQRRYQEAADYYGQALAVSRKSADPARQGRALDGLGFVEFLQGHWQAAVGHLEQALALNRQVGDRIGVAHSLASLGFIELRQGRYQQAAGYLWQSHGLFDDLGDRTGVAHALGNLGEVELRQGRYANAAAHLHQALALCREIGDRSNAADLLAALGVTGLRQGSYQEAAGYLRQALALSRETGDVATQATVLNGLGEVLLATGRPAEARGQHAAALRAATEVGEKYEQARAHDGLASACEASGDLRQARRHWREALTYYTELGAPESEQVRARLAAP